MKNDLTRKDCWKRFQDALQGSLKKRNAILRDWSLEDADGLSQEDVANLLYNGVKSLKGMGLKAMFEEAWDRFNCSAQRGPGDNREDERQYMLSAMKGESQ